MSPRADEPHTEAAWPVEDAPAPIGPHARDRGEITPAGEYEEADLVWLWRAGAWWPGEVAGASELAVQVRYDLGGRGTAVDTVTAEYVMRRGDGSQAERAGVAS